MNGTQKNILVWAAIIFGALGIFPPSQVRDLQSASETMMGYSFIADPPTNFGAGNVRIDLMRLGLQWFILGVVTTILFVANAKQDPPKPPVS